MGKRRSPGGRSRTLGPVVQHPLPTALWLPLRPTPAPTRRPAGRFALARSSGSAALCPTASRPFCGRPRLLSRTHCRACADARGNGLARGLARGSPTLRPRIRPSRARAFSFYRFGPIQLGSTRGFSPVLCWHAHLYRRPARPDSAKCLRRAGRGPELDAHGRRQSHLANRNRAQRRGHGSRPVCRWPARAPPEHRSRSAGHDPNST